MLRELADLYPSVVFATVDVEQLRDSSVCNGISKLPTVEWYHDAKLLEQQVGFDEQRLRNTTASFAARFA